MDGDCPFPVGARHASPSGWALIPDGWLAVFLCGTRDEVHEGGACPAPTPAAGGKLRPWRERLRRGNNGNGYGPDDAGHTGPPDKKWQIAPYSLPPCEGQAGTGFDQKRIT